MTEFYPKFPRDEDTDEEVMIGFTRSEFYDLVYAARNAQIRFKRLRKERRENDTLSAEEKEYWENDCNFEISHYKSMESWLCDKYRKAYGEEW